MKTETQWQQEDDAHTLARAEAIKADPTRLKGAKEAANRMLSEQEKDMQGLRKVAGKNSSRPTQAPEAPKTNQGTKATAAGFTLPRYGNKR